MPGRRRVVHGSGRIDLVNITFCPEILTDPFVVQRRSLGRRLQCIRSWYELVETAKPLAVRTRRIATVVSKSLIQALSSFFIDAVYRECVPAYHESDL
jgi:hypothetical protein